MNLEILLSSSNFTFKLQWNLLDVLTRSHLISILAPTCLFKCLHAIIISAAYSHCVPLVSHLPCASPSLTTSVALLLRYSCLLATNSPSTFVAASCPHAFQLLNASSSPQTFSHSLTSECPLLPQSRSSAEAVCFSPCPCITPFFHKHLAQHPINCNIAIPTRVLLLIPSTIPTSQFLMFVITSPRVP